MRPPETLIGAWCDRLHHIRRASMMLAKAKMMLRCSEGDMGLYRRGDTLTREARSIYAAADSGFRTALRAEWDNRYRIEVIEWNHWRIWVRAAYYNDEHPLEFTPALRPKYAPKRTYK